ncbi:MAG: sulfotransferase [Pirellulales bacterium]|nr:sulfotransferase [Pirellulales bacterium]
MATTLHGVTQPSKEIAGPAVGAKNRFWELRIWSGMCIAGWYGLLWRNRFAIGPSRIGMALILCGVSVINSFLWALQSLLLGRKIRRTEIREAPVFVLGHWRSGTTLLHELLVADPRHTFPDTYACFAPNHFLLSAGMFKWWLRFLLPAKRPMDDMGVGWDHPQEDEWAMCNMGIPSPYLTFVFPNRPPQCSEYLDLRAVPPAALDRWKRAFVWFLRCLTVQNPKRIVLKSPQHTCRVRTLLEIFPESRFVHIVRDPYVVFPSTVKTFLRMSRYHGLQVPKWEDLPEQVFETFTHMYEVFEEDRTRIDPSRFCEVRYEDLVRDPVGQMRLVYERLGLGSFDSALPAVEAYAVRTKDFRTNRYELDPATRDEVTRRWGTFIERYGYAEKTDNGDEETRIADRK